MKIIRRNVFETNSSSTHVLSIPKKVKEYNYNLSTSLDNNYGFGREECRIVNNWDEKLAYLYKVLFDYKDYNKGNIKEQTLKNFKNIANELYNEMLDIVEFKPYENDLKPNDIFKEVEKDNYNVYVDHIEDFSSNGFLEKVLNDRDFLKRFLFNSESYITVGGDEYNGYYVKTIGFEYDYDDHHYVNEKGEKPPKEFFKANGCIKDEYWDRYAKEYIYDGGTFWNKLKEYEKDNDVYFKGN